MNPNTKAVPHGPFRYQLGRTTAVNWRLAKDLLADLSLDHDSRRRMDLSHLCVKVVRTHSGSAIT